MATHGVDRRALVITRRPRRRAACRVAIQSWGRATTGSDRHVAGTSRDRGARRRSPRRQAAAQRRQLKAPHAVSGRQDRVVDVANASDDWQAVRGARAQTAPHVEGAALSEVRDRLAGGGDDGLDAAGVDPVVGAGQLERAGQPEAALSGVMTTRLSCSQSGTPDRRAVPRRRRGSPWRSRRGAGRRGGARGQDSKRRLPAPPRSSAGRPPSSTGHRCARRGGVRRAPRRRSGYRRPPPRRARRGPGRTAGVAMSLGRIEDCPGDRGCRDPAR